MQHLFRNLLFFWYHTMQDEFLLALHWWFRYTGGRCNTITFSVFVSVCTHVLECKYIYQLIWGKHLPSSAFLWWDESSIHPGQPVIHSFISHRWTSIVYQQANSVAHTNTQLQCTYTHLNHYGLIKHVGDSNGNSSLCHKQSFSMHPSALFG